MTDISLETYVVHNGDGSVSLDPWAGKSREELKTRCGELCRGLNEWQIIAMLAATSDGNSLDNLSEPYRSQLKTLIDAYGDDE